MCSYTVCLKCIFRHTVSFKEKCILRARTITFASIMVIVFGDYPGCDALTLDSSELIACSRLQTDVISRSNPAYTGRGPKPDRRTWIGSKSSADMIRQ